MERTNEWSPMPYEIQSQWTYSKKKGQDEYLYYSGDANVGVV
ncbi:MAG: hypothetical protein CM15mP65_02880 [Crocinitomicaceae bacterium]|nr:MAG: hypothetical protein CM15mP65_02880 [Crocinitomicaceae bacterium]